MKESAQIAITLVKKRHPDKADLFKENDLHIHVPSGAVPKDGPSAGITLVTALTSLVTDTPVNPEYAMTGEVSLRGGVMPIGGLPEKLMAAQRAGIKKVFIPAENERDLEEVAEEVKEGRNYLIFAEGTRSRKGNQLLDFKGGSFKSAVKAQCPIVPVALIDSYKSFDTNSIKKLTVQVHFLEPIPYEKYQGMKTTEIAAMVKQRIEETIKEFEEM